MAAALDHIERAQRELGEACALLCPIIGGVKAWERVSKLYDRVHAEWRRIHAWAEKHRGRLDLDGSGRSALAQIQEDQVGESVTCPDGHPVPRASSPPRERTVVEGNIVEHPMVDKETGKVPTDPQSGKPREYVDPEDYTESSTSARTRPIRGSGASSSSRPTSTRGSRRSTRSACW